MRASSRQPRFKLWSDHPSTVGYLLPTSTSTCRVLPLQEQPFCNELSRSRVSKAGQHRLRHHLWTKSRPCTSIAEKHCRLSKARLGQPHQSGTCSCCTGTCREAPHRAPVAHCVWLNMLQDTLIRAATARSAHGFSRASSDAGSVIDSVSSTPKGCGSSRSQQHTLQAVASRLQHVQSCELPYVQHKAMRNSRAAAASGCWDSDNCSDAASWADEHVSCRCKTNGLLAPPLTSCKSFLHHIHCNAA